MKRRSLHKKGIDYLTVNLSLFVAKKETLLEQHTSHKKHYCNRAHINALFNSVEFFEHYEKHGFMHTFQSASLSILPLNFSLVEEKCRIFFFFQIAEKS